MRLVASTPPIGALLHTLEDAPMTPLVAALGEASGEDVATWWDAYWDLSAADEPYYVHARDRDVWYRVDLESDATTDADARAATREPQAVRTTSASRAHAAQFGLAGRWARGATSPKFCFTRHRRVRKAPLEGDALVHASTAAVVAAAVETLVNSPRLSRHTPPRWRTANVRLDAG